MKRVIRFLVGEDLPRSITPTLLAAGFQAEDVRDVGLRGKTDEEVLDYARARRETVLTGDRAFGSTLRFPLGSHSGIIVVRYPDEMPIEQMIQEVLSQIQSLDGAEVDGSVVVLEKGRLRLRSQRADT